MDAKQAEATIARVKARCHEGRDGPYAMYTNVVKDDILDILDQPGEQVPTTQRDRIAEAITREHYRRAKQRIEASPEEHGRAFADAAMTVMQTQPDQVTTIKPGQTLILRYAHQISQADAATIKTRVAERVPGIIVIIIGGCAQMIVYQPDSTAASWPLDA